MLKEVVLAIVLLLPFGVIAQVTPFGEVTCDPTFPEAVTFLIDSRDYTAWYDGEVRVDMTWAEQDVQVQVSRQIDGVILTGATSQQAFPDPDGGAFHLDQEILSVMVCYQHDDIAPVPTPEPTPRPTPVVVGIPPTPAPTSTAVPTLPPTDTE